MQAGEFDEGLHNKFCIAFGEAGLIQPYLDFAERYEFSSVTPFPGPKLSEIVKIAQANNAAAKAFSRFGVVEIGAEIINGWWWAGALVLKRYNVFEIQFEGNNGLRCVGDTISDTCTVASHLVASLPKIGPPYPTPGYNGDNERLTQLLIDLIAYFNDVKTMIRGRLADFPLGSL